MESEPIPTCDPAPDAGQAAEPCAASFPSEAAIHGDGPISLFDQLFTPEELARLRGSAPDPAADAALVAAVSDRAHALGWPVAVPARVEAAGMVADVRDGIVSHGGRFSRTAPAASSVTGDTGIGSLHSHAERQARLLARARRRADESAAVRGVEAVKAPGAVDEYSGAWRCVTFSVWAGSALVAIAAVAALGRAWGWW